MQLADLTVLNPLLEVTLHLDASEWITPDPFDVTSFIQSQYDGGAEYVGFTLRADSLPASGFAASSGAGIRTPDTRIMMRIALAS